MNFCDGGGSLVGGMREIPSDPIDFAWPDAGAIVACCHVVCAACRSEVRSIAGVASTDTTDDALGELGNASLDQLIARGLIVRDASCRLYFCACVSHTEDYGRSLDDDSAWDDGIRRPSWRCGGHAPMTLPTVLDGVSLDDGADAGAIVARTLTGAEPATRPEWTREYAALWTHRLARRLAHAPLGLAIADAIADRLTDGDPRVRAAVADVFRRDPTLPTADRVVAALRDHSSLFVDVPNPFAPREPLDAWLQIAIARRALLGDTEAIALAQQIALAPRGKTTTLLGALFSVDRDWTLGAIERIYASAPSHDLATNLLYQLTRAVDHQTAIAVSDRLASLALLPPDEYRDLARQLVGP